MAVGKREAVQTVGPTVGKVVPERVAVDSECVAVGSGTTANTHTRRSQPVQVEKMAGARVEAMSPSVCAPLLRQTA